MGESQTETGPRPLEFYIDTVQYSVSPFTFTLRCGISRDDPLHVDILVALHMSPQHAKALAQTLQVALRTYEERLGTIPLPEEFREK